jgi:hypothetical protein
MLALREADSEGRRPLLALTTSSANASKVEDLLVALIVTLPLQT